MNSMEFKREKLILEVCSKSLQQEAEANVFQGLSEHKDAHKGKQVNKTTKQNSGQ